MHKPLVFGLLAAIAGSAQAAFNFNIDNPYQNVVLPSSGTITVMFTGTVDVFIPTADITDAFGDDPGLTDTGPFATMVIDPTFQAYVSGSNAGVDYSGNIFSVTFSSADAPGNYFYNILNTSTYAEFIVEGGEGTNVFQDGETFGVTATPVPEPATLAVVGLGVAALVRRRTKK